MMNKDNESLPHSAFALITHHSSLITHHSALFPLIRLYQLDARYASSAGADARQRSASMCRHGPFFSAYFRKYPHKHFPRRIRPSASTMISTGLLSTLPLSRYPPGTVGTS